MTALAVAAVILAGPAFHGDAEAAGLSVQQQEAFSGAQQRGDQIALRSIFIAAIVERPNDLPDILSDAKRLAPGDDDRWRGLAQRYFPALMAPSGSGGRRASDVAVTAPEKGDGLRGSPSAVSEAAKDLNAAGEQEGVWSGDLAIGGSHRNATEDSVNFSSEINARYEDGDWNHSFGLSFDYEATSGDAFTHVLEAEARTRRDFARRYYGYGQVQYTDDRFDGLVYQATEDAGIGYQVIDAETLRLSFEGGPSLRQSRIESSGRTNNELLARLAATLEWDISETATFSNETALLFNNNSLEISSNTGGNFRESTETNNLSAIDLQVIGDLGARFSVEITHQTEPAPGTESTTTESRFSLVQDF